MSISCTININELEDVLTIPISAVQTTNNKKYVLVVENGETKEVEIKTGLSDDEYVQVTSGLQEGQTIQVVTTTKQNTIRNSSSSKGFNTSGNGRSDSSKSGMPSDSNGSGRPSGGDMQKPTTKNN